MPQPRLRAVIYLRDLDGFDRSKEHCDRNGYRVVGVVLDPEGDRWREVMEACWGGQYDVIVLGSFDDLPAGRVPRTDVVDAAPVSEVRPRRRRPKRAG